MPRSQFVIEGGRPISGTLEARGNKNAALPILAAALLTDRGPERLERAQTIARLYNRRSDAVHGRDMSEDSLNLAIRSSTQLLRDLLIANVDRGRVLKVEDFEAALHG